MAVTTRSLRVAIDATLPPGQAGGVDQVILGLASGLSAMPAGDEYLFLVYEGEGGWLRPSLAGPARLQSLGPRPSPIAWRQSLARVPYLRRAYRAVRDPLLGPPPIVLPPEPEALSTLAPQVMHFPSQAAFLTEVPSIYHPHDLQHLHFPEFFTAEQRRWRSVAYQRFAEQAAIVAVASGWTRTDVVAGLGLPAEKVRVVPLAPLREQSVGLDPAEAEALRRTIGLTGDYAFFPAQTWPHKNHVSLLRALARLRDTRGLRVPLVCSGLKNDHFKVIEAEVNRLGLSDQASFVGYVDARTLQALYRGARCVVVPTRFEAGSFPVWEAFLAGVPVACSNVTSLPEQAGDAALLFSPDDVEGMAASIERLWSEPALRERLVERGRARVAGFSWEQTALRFRELYVELAQRRLR